MLPQLISLLTLSATLLHSVLGCCWHHGHHAGAPPRSENISLARSEAESHRCCSGTHHHSPGSDSGKAPEGPCDHDGGRCNLPSCVYDVARQFELPPPDVSGAVLIDAMTERRPATVDASMLHSLAMTPPQRPAPNLRAQLQVWVI